MNRSTLLYFLLLTIFVSCKQAKQNEDTEHQDIKFDVQLVCEQISPDETTPMAALYAVINEGKTKIANISACESIEPKNYTNYQIPSEALAAAGGWWAGAGDYFYAIQKKDRIVILKTSVDEMHETLSYDYKEVASFENGKFHVRKISMLPQLVGLYQLGGHDSSWLFFLGLNGKGIDAHYFEIDGMLPPEEEIVQLLPTLEPQILEKFELDEETLTFDSSLGKGKFVATETGMTIVFEEKESQISDQLVLSKVQ